MELHDVHSVQALDDHRLRLTFDDGSEGVVEIALMVPFEGVFAPLRDEEYFRQVRVDAELGTICWPNGADIDPLVLYSSATGAPLPNWVTPTLSGAPPVDLAPGTDHSVPEISRFFGIVIQMYFREHAPAHFHVRYGGEKASVDIQSLAVLSGDLPPRVIGLVAEWGRLHRKELMKNWLRVRRGLDPEKIAPLE